jgi:Peroxidase, family 2
MDVLLGLIPRSGKHIPLSLIALAIRRHYDLCPTFAFQLTSSAAYISQQSGGRDWMDLDDLSAPNMIEHDASLTRKPDNADQKAPSSALTHHE